MRRALGIDIGSTNTRIGLIDENGVVTNRVRWKTEPKNLARTLVKEIKVFSGYEAFGIASVGPLDMNEGTILNPPYVKIRNLRIVDLLKEEFGQPCYLLNDCVAGAVAEKRFGAGKRLSSIVYITISTGIGAGVFVDDRLLLGKDGNAHEVGHFKIDCNSTIKDDCGSYGCWSSLCSGSGIPKYVSHLLGKEYSRKETRLREVDKLTAGLFFEMAKSDFVASEILGKIGRLNAIGVANVIDAYDPELITMGGSVVRNNPQLVKQVRRWVGDYALNRLPKIAATSFGDDICLIGAGASAIFHDWKS